MDDQEGNHSNRIAGDEARIPANDEVEAPGLSRRSESWFRPVVENASEIVTISDPDGTLRYANPAWQRVLGYVPEEAIGKMDLFDHIHPQDLPLVQEEIEEAFAEGGIAVNTVEYRFRHRDGSWPWLESVGTYLLDDPAMRDVVFNSRDITERKRAEEALKASEERFRLLAENAQDIIFRYRLSPRPGFEYISPSATRVVGYTPEEHYANPNLLLRMVSPDDRHVIEGFMEPSQEVGGTLSAMRIRRKDGREIWCESRHRNIYDSEGNPVAIEGIVRDVTERKRAEKALRETHSGTGGRRGGGGARGAGAAAT